MDHLEADLGRRVRDLRLSQELAQEELARRANVSVGALRHLESGSGATLRTLMRVLQALGQERWLETLAPPAPSFSPLQVLRTQQADALRSHRRVRRSTSA